jgi:phage-related protein
MSFFALSFIYDTFNSEEFGLFISSMDSGGITSSTVGSGVNLITKKILRNPVEYLYGVEQGPGMEFELTFNSATALSAEDRNIISSFLFGQLTYKKLQIIQYDLENVYFNCIFKNPVAVYVGNVQYGWKCTAVCDSPFAYEYATTLTRTGSPSSILNETISFNNLSANADYTYPLITFTTNGTGDSFSIRNTTDSNRTFAFTGISAGETISVDNLKQIISSSTGLMRISKFNLSSGYGFLRLLPGINSLTAVGGVTQYSITYTPFKKIGG